MESCATSPPAPVQLTPVYMQAITPEGQRIWVQQVWYAAAPQVLAPPVLQHTYTQPQNFTWMPQQLPQAFNGSYIQIPGTQAHVSNTSVQQNAALPAQFSQNYMRMPHQLPQACNGTYIQMPGNPGQNVSNASVQQDAALPAQFYLPGIPALVPPTTNLQIPISGYFGQTFLNPQQPFVPSAVLDDNKTKPIPSPMIPDSYSSVNPKVDSDSAKPSQMGENIGGESRTKQDGSKPSKLQDKNHVGLNCSNSVREKDTNNTHPEQRIHNLETNRQWSFQESNINARPQDWKAPCKHSSFQTNTNPRQVRKGFHGDTDIDEELEAQLFGSLDYCEDIDFHAPVMIEGDKIPQNMECFDEDIIPPYLLENISRCKLARPTPVQQYIIPSGLLGQNLLACAPMGSGKRTGYLLLLIILLLQKDAPELKVKSIVHRRVSFPYALVLVPTYEIGQQIQKEALRFCYRTGVRPVFVYGGQVAQINARLNDLRQGVDILIATPTALIQFLERGNISLELVQFFVVDDAHKMAKFGFESQIKTIKDKFIVSRTSLTLVFSELFSDKAYRVGKSLMESFTFLEVGRVESPRRRHAENEKTAKKSESCKVNIPHQQTEQQEPVPNQLGTEQISALKEAADGLYRTGRFQAAHDKYTEALKLGSFENEFTAVLLCNRAAACMALGCYTKAAEDCHRALMHDPSYSKALLRRARARVQLCQYQLAIGDFKAYLAELSPESEREYIHVRAELESAQAAFNQRQPKWKQPPIIASCRPEKTHYDALNLHKSATFIEIKKAYRTLALQYHPDKNKDMGSAEIFTKIQGAYEVLSDEMTRKEYDAELRVKSTFC